MQIDCGIMTTTTPYLPGGTASLLLGESIGRIEPNGKGGDIMGRWSFISLRRQGLPPLIIYTIYQVNPTPTNTVGITAWHQQRLQLNLQGRDHIHPRTAFTIDIIKQIQLHQQQGCDIILGGDFNDTLQSRNSNLFRIANSTNLVDPWTRIYPNHPTFNTHHRGTTRIDATFCSHSLLPAISHIGYPPFSWFTNSDHRGVLIDFHADKLFRNQPTSPQPIVQRGIRSNDQKNVGIFIQQ